MSETLFYDPETLADCILENLKCPLLFVCITCYTARPSPLSLSRPSSRAGDSRGWKRWKWPLLAENVEAQWNTRAIARAVISAPGVSRVYPRIERKWGEIRVLRLSTTPP